MSKDNIKKNISKNNSDCTKLRKSNKTLIAIIILLSGIAIGSFFVDVVQLFSGKGFSARALEDAQVVEYNGNTWVRYDDPKIVVDVFDADDCADCITDEVLVRLRSLIPTLEAHKIDVRTDEGREYAKENNIKYIPSFLFSEDIIDSDFYQGAAILFKNTKNNKYYFESANVGVPIGEYLEEPSTDTGITIGNEDAKISLVVFTDFACDMCKVVNPIISKIQDEFKDNIKLIIKITPDKEVKNSTKLALAAQCANNQDVFEKYSELLFKNQKTIVKMDNISEILSKYAKDLNMDIDEFDKCINSKNSKKIIEDNITEASRFGITGTPTLFVNGQPHIGVITYDNLKEEIEAIK